ncbi:hypothetical protein ACQP2U_31275 [Nocardia sp. CA-084685]|uniref:hypothetical protein n=1 Tax=Nocardia sp. CA-084685 TaxID=3239970 RepID=UPI003D99B241
MNRIAISITMLIPPLFLLSLLLAQPVSAAPSNGAATAVLPWGSLATAGLDGGFLGMEVVIGDRTGSACPAGGGLARVPDPLRVAPLVVNVAPSVLGSRITPGPARVDIAPGALGVNVTPDSQPVNVAPDAARGNIAPDVLRADRTPDMLDVGSAFDMRSAGGAQTQIFDDGATPLTIDIARGGGTGSASSLPRVLCDLLSRLLSSVEQAPLPLTR